MQKSVTCGDGNSALLFKASARPRLLQRCPELRHALRFFNSRPAPRPGVGGGAPSLEPGDSELVQVQGSDDDATHFVIKMLNSVCEEATCAGVSPQRRPREVSSEFQVPLRLPPHPGIVTVLHHFRGSTAAYQSFLALLSPLSELQELSPRRGEDHGDADDVVATAAFVAMPAYDVTLQRWIEDRKTAAQGTAMTAIAGGDSSGGDGGDGVWGVPETHWRSLLLQALDVLSVLQKHFVAHRNIKVGRVRVVAASRTHCACTGFGVCACVCARVCASCAPARRDAHVCRLPLLPPCRRRCGSSIVDSGSC